MRSARSITRAAVLVGYALGAAALSSPLPAEIPPSWTGAGGNVIWLGGPMVAFLLPTAIAVIDSLLRGLCVTDPIDSDSAANQVHLFDAIIARIALFVLGVHAAVLAGLLGLLSGRDWTARIVPLLLGVTMIAVGNLLPRVRPNIAIGIRTRRTLSDRACWMRTHRRAGYLIVAAGVVVALSAIAVPKPLGPGMILAIGPAVLVGAWLLPRLQRREVIS
jgi:uncharacterized membrane protein